MKNILFIHQSAELYGSDRTLLLLVTSLIKNGMNPVVVLPHEGPLSGELEKAGVKIIYAPVIKISRKMFTARNLLALPKEYFASLRVIKDSVKEMNIELVYSNTLAVLIGFLYARKYKLPHIWHVHEIIEHPQVVTKFFKRILQSKINKKLIFNSNATHQFWDPSGKLNAATVWNGIEKPADSGDPEKIKLLRDEAGLKPEDIVIGLVGRINRLKGQQLLLEAFSELSNKNCKLIFVGSPPPNQEEYLINLTDKINQFELQERVKILPFQSDIWNIWEIIDLAVVPSTEPESFGLVAVEAMLCGKPVVASRIGGLSEIVVHQETGILFEARNLAALKDALNELILDPEKCASMGQKGKQRAETFFTLDKYVSQIQQICQNI